MGRHKGWSGVATISHAALYLRQPCAGTYQEWWLQVRAEHHPDAACLPMLNGDVAAIAAAPVSMSALDWELRYTRSLTSEGSSTRMSDDRSDVDPNPLSPYVAWVGQP
ncbi:hypothetical protein [Bradyrhizobium sp. NC92]|uniref:hypothetical protein n=1 Tax=Bradyrhizobium sp. (strain NC92) TaxID=55395 RepID=UPI0021AA4836|nr:hypothetical protein [Bradyrhizobium sp. NC92]UWU68110.1 hypothetical protein N2602_34160 [Bradyrhizobium sp. NC92]